MDDEDLGKVFRIMCDILLSEGYEGIQDLLQEIYPIKQPRGRFWGPAEGRLNKNVASYCIKVKMILVI